MTLDVTPIVLELVSQHLSVPLESVTPDASLVRDLGADSLDVVELIMAIEERFEIEITNADAATIHTVREAADAIRARIASADTGPA